MVICGFPLLILWRWNYGGVPDFRRLRRSHWIARVLAATRHVSLTTADSRYPRESLNASSLKTLILAAASKQFRRA
jgi:hypothetical protein